MLGSRGPRRPAHRRHRTARGRRIDNQLRGRAGRQGDPGSSRFYLSLEDDLMRIFGSDRIAGLMQRLGMEEGVPIEHGMVTRAIERAQKQVEAQNFSVRKHLLEYDDVMNKQRENIYALRRQILEGKIKFDEEPRNVDTREYLMSLAEDMLDDMVETLRAARGRLRAVGSRRAEARGRRRSPSTRRSRIDFSDRTADEIRDSLWERDRESYEEKETAGRPRRAASASSATSCCRSSTRSGRTISTASTT